MTSPAFPSARHCLEMRHTQRTGTEWSQCWCRIPNTRLSRSELVAQRHLMFGHFLSVWLKYDVTGLFFTDSSFICKPSIILFRKLQTFAFLIQSCSLRKTNRCPRTTSKKQTVRAANCPCNPHKKEFLLKKKTKEGFLVVMWLYCHTCNKQKILTCYQVAGRKK